MKDTTIIMRLLHNQVIKTRLLEQSLNQGLYADVHFLLDDGSSPAHRALLMARCDVMDAMFAGDFRESSAKVASPFSTLMCPPAGISR